MKIKKIALLCIFTLLITNSFSQSNPANFTNKAISLLTDVQNLVVLEDWNSANTILDRALIYDSNISDFYYVKALCELNIGSTSSTIIPLLEKSLDFERDWYQYTREDARLFLARQYSIVKRYNDALVLLNAYPVLQSATADLERVRAYYASNELEKARQTVLDGARQYPDDFRFVDLFYSGEIMQLVCGDASLSKDSDYVDFFNGRVQSFSDEKPELLLFATLFSNDEHEIELLLKSYNTHNVKSPLYAVFALINGLQTEQEAFDYIQPFLNNIRYDVFAYFMTVLKDADVKNQIANYFATYSGTVRFDFNGDFLDEFLVTYKNGRPQYSVYDQNQDGILDWEMSADFGLPTSVNFVPENVTVEYSTWPCIKSVTRNSACENMQVFNIVDNTLELDIVRFETQPELKNIGTDFYIPVVLSSRDELSVVDVFNASYSVDYYKNATTKTEFTVLDGNIKKAEYFADEKLFAQAQFEDGLIVSRLVDRNFDGIFELTEEYSYSDSSKTSQKIIDEVICFEHLANGLYLAKTHVALEDDGLWDFSQTYNTDGSTITRWLNSRGVAEIILIQKDDFTEIQYLNPFTNSMKSVVLHDGVPVLSDGKDVIKDSKYDFYWIGENFDSSFAKMTMTELDTLQNIAGLIVSEKLWNAEAQQFLRIVGVKNGDLYFGEAYYQ